MSVHSYCFCGLTGCTSVFESVRSQSSIDFTDTSLQFSFKINSGNEYTNQLDVNLSLNYQPEINAYAFAYSQAECESSLNWNMISLQCQPNSTQNK